MVEAVWFVNTRSYAIDTSPAAVNSWGIADVIFVVSTENSSDELSYIANRFPVISPNGPMLSLTRSPDAVAQLEGDQSNSPKFPDVNPNTSPVVVTSDTISATPPAAVSSPYAINDAAAVDVPPTARSHVTFPGASCCKLSCQ